VGEPDTPDHKSLAPHLVVARDGPIAIVRLNRPEARNALSGVVLAELTTIIEDLDLDAEIRAIVITGNERVFAAGADIAEMADVGAIEMHLRRRFTLWERLRHIRTPLIAAVSGWALGGGNELAMVCDLIVASETARFGQPEITLGIMPGAGGTQRLVRAVGKARAMELVLTGRPMSAREAYEAGLITKVVGADAYLTEAVRLAHEIAQKPPIAVQLTKDAVLRAFDTTLEAGLAYERRAFELCFATEDHHEGMRAFLTKRTPTFEGH